MEEDEVVRFTTETFVKWMKFYNEQGLTLQDCIDLLEYDGTLFDKSKPVRSA